MEKSTQENRQLKIETPLGKDVLLLNRFETKEKISSLFSYQAELIVDEQTYETKAVSELDVSKLLGQIVTVTVEISGKDKRKFIGIISKFSQIGRRQRYSHYRAKIVPSVWRMTQSIQSRIFQQKTVPEILEEMLVGFKNRITLRKTYKPRNFCVQYNESDFDFISRLMEEEGIFFYFDHTGKEDELVIMDDYTTPKSTPNYSKYRFQNPEEAEADLDTAAIQAFSIDYSLHSGKETLWDHNFQLPLKKLDTEIVSRNPIGGNQKMEVFEYPGFYAKRYDGIDPTGAERGGDLSTIFSDNKRIAESRMFASDSRQRMISGHSAGVTFTAGHIFYLTDHPNSTFNVGYILVEVRQALFQHPSFEGIDDEPDASSTDFLCVPHGAGFPEYRPLPTKKRPTIPGSQTAVVVGPAGEEIFTDKYGRIKVQFHWDRDGKYDAKSSCWIRVSQPWAGKNWGTICIPRIGQEVIVDFIGGDPDQPIVTGSVYNPAQMPPYELPGNANTMGFKSDTTKGGNGYNEIAIVDGKAGELIRIHAQKDMDTTVLNNDKQLVVADRTIEVFGKHNETVKEDMETTVTDGNQINTVKTGDQTNTVETGNQTNTVKTGDQENKVSAGSQTNTVKNDIKITSESGAVRIEAATEIVLQVGDTIVKLTPDGIAVGTSGTATSESAGVTIIKGSQVDIN